MKQTEAQTQEEFTPKKKRALVTYLSVIAAAAFLLVALSMFVNNRTMQEEFDEEHSRTKESHAQAESSMAEQIESQEASHEAELSEMERRAKASELLALADHAYHDGNWRAFEGYMAELEGCADALSEEMTEIYDELVTAQRGK